MALGAMAANPGLQVQIVPVGLSYFHPERFRSRAVVEFGKPIPVPQELVNHFKTGGSAKHDATSKLLEVIYEALRTVTLRAPDYDTLMVRTSLLHTKTVYSRRHLSAHPSSKTIVQGPWPAFEPQPSSRAEQAIHRWLPPLSKRASCTRTPEESSEVQPAAA